MSEPTFHSVEGAVCEVDDCNRTSKLCRRCGAAHCDEHPHVVDLLTVEASTYGCGSATCAACYPRQYACAWCGLEFEKPIANPDITGEPHVCPKCGYDQINPDTIEGDST